MSRLIDADALIDELQKDEAKFDKEAEDAQNDPSYTECYSDAMWSRANGIRDAIIEVYDAPTIDAVSEWIPCSERLPSENEEVLVCDKDGTMEVCDLETFGRGVGLKWTDKNGYECWLDVVAWMPLPKPYGERKGE